MLTRDLLLGSFQRKYDTVKTDIGDARIQNLNESEISEFYLGQLTTEGKINEQYQRERRRRLVVLVLVDGEGKRILDQPGDIGRLGPGADSAVISQIFLAALEHCGMTKLEEEREELEKN